MQRVEYLANEPIRPISGTLPCGFCKGTGEPECHHWGKFRYVTRGLFPNCKVRWVIVGIVRVNEYARNSTAAHQISVPILRSDTLRNDGQPVWIILVLDTFKSRTARAEKGLLSVDLEQGHLLNVVNKHA